MTRLPALRRLTPGGIRSAQKTSGLFNVDEKVFSFELSDDGALPVMSIASQNLTPSPLTDLGQFLFPAAEETGMLSLEENLVNVEDDIFGNLMLSAPSPECRQSGDDVEFGEVYTDINSLLTLACPPVVYDEDTTTTGSVVVPSVAPDDDSSMPPDTCILTISVPLNSQQQQYTTINAHTFITSDEPAHTATHEPDHSYSSSVKQNTRKRNYSEMSEDIIDKKSTKYLERRRKNNIASKRSREMRKNKFLTMDEQAAELEKANDELRQKIEQLESLTKKMKEALVAKLSSAK